MVVNVNGSIQFDCICLSPCFYKKIQLISSAKYDLKITSVNNFFF